MTPLSLDHDRPCGHSTASANKIKRASRMTAEHKWIGALLKTLPPPPNNKTTRNGEPLRVKVVTIRRPGGGSVASGC